ncbi:unnamed protein product (macronuclear) [Paramecium tetraurelia]|uniref:Uncharacterized protein n=1 Tax=Paramecium tetraurelia TaxID=5888 RepID=A0CZW0_PARTE|nr:uncharacterized protein GSPATT00011900001 [Paramecium tetraurelia]CAK76327.1 unnamed protein product [Paramecium tetraurelia]|eukprot:XP_001443724.1 hypothetical protein (macronuclear) [Paramecium tetraurelia strain d4-2]
MEQAFKQDYNFPGNIIDLTDSQQELVEDSQQYKPLDGLTERILRKRKNCPLNKSLYDQLFSDPIYKSCIQNEFLFIKHLESLGFNDIYDYLKHCNKNGILLEDEAFKKYNIKPPQSKYNLYQCKIIHEKNVDFRNIQQILSGMKQLKKTMKLESKSKKDLNIEFYQTNDTTTNFVIHQTKQHRYIAPNLINKMLYEVEPLNQEINENLIHHCWKQYRKFYNKCLEEYQAMLNGNHNEFEDELSETNIDFDQMSQDSLAPWFIDPPYERKPQYRSMNLSYQIQHLKILQLSVI